MRKLRTFIAVELAPSVISRAQQLIERLRGTGVEANWVPAENMHLTLKFLGDVLETETPDICRAAAEAARQFEPFELVFRGAGAFPDVARPRTLWLGVATGGEELVRLAETLEDLLQKKLGFPKERRRFVPHLTLGRVRRIGDDAERLAALLAEHADYDADLSVVEEVVTFASFLGRGGARHEPLDHAPLAG